MVLILLRHGKTIWNKKNILAGSTKNIDLSEDGKIEAKNVCKILKKYNFDYVFTSDLKRAKDTCSIIKDELNQSFCVINSNKINERNFGFLAGKNKFEIENIYGAEKIKNWLHSYNGKPPNGESIREVSIRFGNYFDENILPLLKNNKNILIISHSYSLKGLLIHLGLKDSNNIDEFIINNCKPIKVDLKNKFFSYEKD
jgi:2,3-bisphosphoglycerate-dependent phosphoglycerate mutase